MKKILPLVFTIIILTGLSGIQNGPAFAQTITPPNFKVAFIGDQGFNSNSVAVLQLIANENADMVLHQGDFDYVNNPTVWNDQINDILGPAFPYFASVGNHDEFAWSTDHGFGTYQQKLQDRLNLIPDAVCTGDLGVKSSCHYQGLFFILSGVGTMSSGHESYIQSQLASDDSVWSICSWHKNQNAMQVGQKSNAVGWGAYEECRKGGAIIATAHEHSYERTKTLTSTQNQVVDPAWTNPNEVRVAVDSTFVFVSGLGGKSIRNQDRCTPYSSPYGCSGEWASIYTTNQSANHGALFCSFNVGGQGDKASCYFKNISGQIIDSFNVTSFMGSDNSNSAPVANDDSSTTDEDTPVAITLTASDDDVGDVLTYFVVSGPSNGSLSGSSPNLTYTPDPDYNGSDSFTFKANDGTDVSNTATISITVNPVNDMPTANAGTDQTVIDTDVVNLDGSGSSDTEGAITFSWSQSSGIPITLSDSSASNPTFTAPGVSISNDLTFDLTVTDGGGLTDTDTIIVTVDPKPLASVTITSPQPGEISGKKTISATVEGFEGTVTVTFEIYKIDGVELVSVYSDSVSIAPYSTSIHTKNLEKDFSYIIMASANDGNGNADSDSVDVNIPAKGGGGSGGEKPCSPKSNKPSCRN